MLKTQLQAGEIKKYVTQKTFPITIKKQHICNHIVDFFVTNNDGSTKIVEAKGYATGEWKLKHKLCVVCYPKIPYEIVVEHNRWNTRLNSVRGLRKLSQT